MGKKRIKIGLRSNESKKRTQFLLLKQSAKNVYLILGGLIFVRKEKGIVIYINGEMIKRKRWALSSRY